jgi:hypothetical protein
VERLEVLRLLELLELVTEDELSVLELAVLELRLVDEVKVVE